jgi:hypothetical protein
MLVQGPDRSVQLACQIRMAPDHREVKRRASGCCSFDIAARSRGTSALQLAITPDYVPAGYRHRCENGPDIDQVQWWSLADFLAERAARSKAGRIHIEGKRVESR